LHRAIANVIPNIVGILTAEVAFSAKCRWIDEGYKVCSGAHFWFGQTGAVTIGSTIITSSSHDIFMADKVTVRHEKTHGQQWAGFGVGGFLGAWLPALGASVVSGNYQSSGGGCLNFLERSAGTAGDYAKCGW